MSAPAPAAFCPYVGLQPYTEEQRDYFFGREADQRIISANLYASSLTVMYGATGVGKTSVLLAAVVPHLRGASRTAVVVFRHWEDPAFLAALKARLLDDVRIAQGRAVDVDAAAPLDELIAAANRSFDGTLLILLDQFEEYFLYQSTADAHSAFESELARVVNRNDLEASVLISLHEESLAKLDQFRARIPNLLGNTLRLRHLDLDRARAAICKPLAVYNRRFAAAITIEDELVEAVLAQVRTREVVLSDSAGRGGAELDEPQIESPFLQLVMSRLWQQEMAEGSSVLRRGTLDRLGGASEIVRSHLDGVMQALDAADREVCARIFDRLVTPTGMKVACAPEDLMQYAGDLAERVPRVLRTLSDGKTLVLRTIELPVARGRQRYEIFHNVLAPAILDWRTRHVRAQRQADAERKAEEQRQRADEQGRIAGRLRRRSLARIMILVATLALAGAGWVQARRANKAEKSAKDDLSEAARQADLATASYLLGVAGASVATHVDLALLLGLEALRIDPNGAAPRMLRGAMLQHPMVSAVLSGHTDQVLVEAISPDGRLLASGGRDHSILLWDLTTRRRFEAPLLAHTGWVTAIVFSPDGRTLASGGRDGKLVLWDVASRTPSSWVANPGGVNGVAFSRDGELVATAGKDGNVVLWNVATHEARVRLGTGTEPLDVAFSPDGTMLASGCEDGNVRLWRTDTREPIGQPLSCGGQPVQSIAFSPDGQTLAAGGGWEGKLLLWNVAKGGVSPDAPRSLNGPRSLNRLAFSPRSDVIAAGYGDDTVILWNVATQKRIGRALRGHGGWVNAVAFHPDGDRLVSASDDMTLMVWNLAPLVRAPGDVDSVAFAPDGTRLAGSGCWRKEGKQCAESAIRFWDTATRQQIGPTLRTNGAPISSIAFSTDGNVLASGGCAKPEEDYCHEGEVRFWDVRTGEQLGAPLSHHRERVWGLAFAPDGKTLVSGGNDSVIGLWDWPARKWLGDIRSGESLVLSSFAFSPDGTTLAAPNAGILWNVATQRALRGPAGLGQELVWSVSSSSDRRLAALGTDTMVVLWDLVAQREVRRLTPQPGPIYALAFGPRGDVLAAATSTNVLVLWDIARGEKVAQFPSLGSVFVVEFSGDGKTLATLDGNAILLRDVAFATEGDAKALRTRACGIANRNLSQDEWKRYLADQPYRETCPAP
jgi:WD40 repeat protein